MNMKQFYHIGPKIYIVKHHEDYPAIQKIFLHSFMNYLFDYFQDICNPFKEDELIVLETGQVMIPEIQSCLGNLLEMNEVKYQNFCKRRLIISKNNPLNLLSSFDPVGDKACIPKIQ